MMNVLKFLLFVLTTIYACDDDLDKRLDCHLENKFTLNKSDCEERGCIWDPNTKSENIPKCYLNTETVGYKVVGNRRITSRGFEADLGLKVTAKPLLKSMPQIDRLKLEVYYLTENIMRFKIIDPKLDRYEVPIQKDFPLFQQKLPIVDENSTKYLVELSGNDTDFDFSVLRRNSKIKIFDTSIGGLIFSDQLLQIATYLPTKYIYGMGENTHTTLKHDLNYKTWAMFSRGLGPDTDVINMYGVHPFYTCLENDGKSHGILFLNSNAMDYTLLPEPALALKTIGGILDIFVFVGDNPEHVIQLYTSLIGRTFVPPFWALGFQLTRYGFKSTENVKEVLERNIKAKVPLDVTYLDIDYLDEFEDFTYDAKNFANLPQLMASTKKDYNLRWNLIIEPHIEANNSKYPAFMDGYNNDVYIKWPKSVRIDDRHNPPDVPTDRDVYYGQCWPKGPTAYVDFFKTQSEKWWLKWLKNMYTEQNLKFDALWTDMNEPIVMDLRIPFMKITDTCPDNKYDYPEVRTQTVWANVLNGQLSNFTVCMVTLQGQNNEFTRYDVHSLYGLSESIVTQRVLQNITGKRGFALSRSNYVSSGRYTAHWLGDNTSKWSQMRDSIIGILEFNLFGINFVGADICGFLQNSTADLCRRWSQLGAFYPFSRNHNEFKNRDQDPAVWLLRGHPEVTNAAINSLNLRYTLLPYLYTLFYRANTKGETVARPLFHEYPADKNTYEIDKQFMWGRAVLISPFLYENQTEVEAYLPDTDVWYESWPQIQKMPNSGHINIPDDMPSGPPPVHYRSGSVLPITTTQTHINTDSVRNGGLTLVVLPDKHRTAIGDLFWDDGESIDTIEKGVFNYYSFELLANCSLILNVEKSGYSSAPKVDYIKVYDTNCTDISASVDGNKVNAKSADTYGMTRIDVKIDLKSKKSNDKWVITWADSNNKCNFN